jgi:hypothetical protein
MRCKRLVAYEHDDDGANNLHCHLVIEESEVEKKQLRNIANSIIDVKGPKMSFRSEYDGDERGFSYMTKGKYSPIYILGWTMDDHDVWKSHWVPPKDYVKQTYWRKLYDKFSKEVTITERDEFKWEIEQWNRDPGTYKFPMRYSREEIQKKVASFVLKENQGLWSPKAGKDFQFLRDQVFIDKGLGFPYENVKRV